MDLLELSFTTVISVTGPNERCFDYWIFDLVPALPLAVTVEYPSEIHKAQSDVNWTMLFKKKKICFDFWQYQWHYWPYVMVEVALVIGQSVGSTGQVLEIAKVTSEYRDKNTVRILTVVYQHWYISSERKHLISPHVFYISTVSGYSISSNAVSFLDYISIILRLKTCP